MFLAKNGLDHEVSPLQKKLNMNLDEQIKDVLAFLSINNIHYKKDYLIKYDTYFKMGGNIKLYIFPDDYNKLVSLLAFLNERDILYKVIGFTSNIFILDEVEYSIFVTTKNLASIELNCNSISVDAGYSLQEFVRVTAMARSKGFEGLEGIPGSIGGAIFMNAGAYGYSISDNVDSVECIGPDNVVKILNKNECNFDYRESVFKRKNLIILRAHFNLTEGNRSDIEKKIETYHIARHSYQDYVYPNLGSMISLKGNIYYQIVRSSKMYLLIYWVLKYLFKNPLAKFINRKRPNNIVFNKLVSRYLISVSDETPKYIPSKKSVNILINDGTVGTKEIVDYILNVHDMIERKYPIENEVVLSPIYSIPHEFEGTYNYIATKLSEHKGCDT